MVVPEAKAAYELEYALKGEVSGYHSGLVCVLEDDGRV